MAMAVVTIVTIVSVVVHPKRHDLYHKSVAHERAWTATLRPLVRTRKILTGGGISMPVGKLRLEGPRSSNGVISRTVLVEELALHHHHGLLWATKIEGTPGRFLPL